MAAREMGAAMSFSRYPMRRSQTMDIPANTPPKRTVIRMIPGVMNAR